MRKDGKLITPAEYARLRGLNRSTVSRQIADGSIPSVGGKIDPIAADQARHENLDQTRRNQHAARKLKRAAIPKAARGRKAVKAAAGAVAAITGSTSKVETLTEAQARKESALADLRTMEARKMKGELLDVAEVRETWSRHIAAAKNRLLMLESKVPAECMAAVKKEVRAALIELSEYNPAATAAKGAL